MPSPIAETVEVAAPFVRWAARVLGRMRGASAEQMDESVNPWINKFEEGARDTDPNPFNARSANAGEGEALGRIHAIDGLPSNAQEVTPGLTAATKGSGYSPEELVQLGRIRDALRDLRGKGNLSPEEKAVLDKNQGLLDNEISQMPEALRQELGRTNAQKPGTFHDQSATPETKAGDGAPPQEPPPSSPASGKPGEPVPAVRAGMPVAEPAPASVNSVRPAEAAGGNGGGTVSMAKPSESGPLAVNPGELVLKAVPPIEAQIHEHRNATGGHPNPPTHPTPRTGRGAHRSALPSGPSPSDLLNGAELEQVTARDEARGTTDPKVAAANHKLSDGSTKKLADTPLPLDAADAKADLKAHPGDKSWGARAADTIKKSAMSPMGG